MTRTTQLLLDLEDGDDCCCCSMDRGKKMDLGLEGDARPREQIDAPRGSAATRRKGDGRISP